MILSITRRSQLGWKSKVVLITLNENHCKNLFLMKKYTRIKVRSLGKSHSIRCFNEKVANTRFCCLCHIRSTWTKLLPLSPYSLSIYLRTKKKNTWTNQYTKCVTEIFLVPNIIYTLIYTVSLLHVARSFKTLPLK